MKSRTEIDPELMYPKLFTMLVTIFNSLSSCIYLPSFSWLISGSLAGRPKVNSRKVVV